MLSPAHGQHLRQLFTIAAGQQVVAPVPFGQRQGVLPQRTAQFERGAAGMGQGRTVGLDVRLPEGGADAGQGQLRLPGETVSRHGVVGLQQLASTLQARLGLRQVAGDLRTRRVGPGMTLRDSGNRVGRARLLPSRVSRRVLRLSRSFALPESAGHSGIAVARSAAADRRFRTPARPHDRALEW